MMRDDILSFFEIKQRRWVEERKGEEKKKRNSRWWGWGSARCLCGFLTRRTISETADRIR
jgi:hypothetical protein